MVAFTLRKARDADLPEIIRLWKGNIKTANTSEDIAELFHSSRYFFFVAGSRTAEGAEKLMGFVGGSIRGSHGHISGIAVDRDYQRSGVGNALIRMLERELRAKSFDLVTLEVRKSNRSAIHFYEMLDYQPSYLIHAYYADGEDAYVFAKKI
jgi:ribosomal-protein-alanine N-acetyltransferase